MTACLVARIGLHPRGEGADFCARYGLIRLVWAERGETIEECIAHENRLKRWRREWKLVWIERSNPDWLDLFDTLA